MTPRSTINGSTAWLKVACSPGHTCTDFEKKKQKQLPLLCEDPISAGACTHDVHLVSKECIDVFGFV